MPNKRRMQISLKRNPAMHVTREAVKKQKVVYVLIADKKVRYEKGNSKVVYIGMTRKGVSRLARSVAARAQKILGKLGIRSFDVRIVTCKGRPNVKSRRLLERGLLVTFRKKYGNAPLCNTQGRRMRMRNVEEYFRQKALTRILEELA